MTKRIENFLKNLSIVELNEVRNTTANLIHEYEDGFQYECKVRSYGRNWTQKLNNSHAVQDLCYEYDGDDGIIDVYTNNPDLSISNYGNTYYFPSMEDAKCWRDFIYIKNNLPGWKKELVDWENREDIPYNQRPHYAPSETEEDIAMYELQVAAGIEGAILMPVILKYIYEEQ